MRSPPLPTASNLPARQLQRRSAHVILHQQRVDVHFEACFDAGLLGSAQATRLFWRAKGQTGKEGAYNLI